jgi:RNA polymerase sigma factor (sigma-70 family)
MSGRFPTTRFSALLGARSDDDGERRRSWDTLALAYWKPAYKHVRVRWRKERAEAEDLIQAFFERAMAKDFFDGYDADRARFRTFFRVCLDRFVSNEEKSRARQKRGGDALTLDFEAAEDELARAHTDGTPEELFDREWRRSVFALAIEALREHLREDGKEAWYRAFERYDLADERPTYDALAADLGVPATTITNRLAHARRELRRIVLEKLEELTASRREFAEEARDVLGA